MKTKEQPWLVTFTIREEELLQRWRKVGSLKLPERLANWRLWIGDSVMYLNELRNAVEDAETGVA